MSILLPKIRSSEASFYHYLQEIQKFPLLSIEEEQKYGERFQRTGDKEAAKMLIQSHLRLVVKIASKFRTYGLPIVDLVSEGNVGLIQAVKKFDPKKGFRFSTYAMWWIKAYIQEYILRSWSMVKIGTTVAQKKLFFNLRKIKKRLEANETGNLLPEQIKIIAHDLNVSEKEVIDMNARLQHSDGSLNQIIGDEEDGVEVGDKIASNLISQEDLVINNQEKSRQILLLEQAMDQLNNREREILTKRQMSEEQPTLDDLSKIYKISKERVRQIEAAALDKIKKFVKASL
ncbi:MAG: polymerase factor sigma-32 [Rickettsiaceae bacterium]|jgi:RNA polymerase sigma-32 factor|nr:polymerase factor sigma-32 [Rickettsiaceae bacterium]